MFHAAATFDDSSGSPSSGQAFLRSGQDMARYAMQAPVARAQAAAAMGGQYRSIDSQMNTNQQALAQLTRYKQGIQAAAPEPLPGLAQYAALTARLGFDPADPQAGAAVMRQIGLC